MMENIDKQNTLKRVSSRSSHTLMVEELDDSRSDDQSISRCCGNG